MKKLLYLCSLAVLAAMTTSCMDVIHIISMKNGVIHTTVRYTLQKSVLEMGASFSGESVDYDEFLDFGDEMFSNISGAAGQLRKHETPFDIGAEVTFQGREEVLLSLLEGNTEFIPKKHGDAYRIEIPLMGDGDDDEDEFAMVFLSGSKYRIMVSLNDDLAHITQADLYLDSGYGEQGIIPMPLHDSYTVTVQGPLMLIEIPMALFFMSEGKIIVELS